MTAVDIVVAELAANRAVRGAAEPLRSDNKHMQDALNELQAGSVTASIPDNRILSNISGASGPALPNTLSQIITHNGTINAEVDIAALSSGATIVKLTDAATNPTGITMSMPFVTELQIQNSKSQQNVAALLNTDANGFVGLTFRASDGFEHGAVGYGNPLTGAPWAGNMGIEVSTYDYKNQAYTPVLSFTASCSTTVLTVSSAVTGGNLAVGMLVAGNSAAANTIITSLGTGTGQAGTYNVSVSQTLVSGAMTANYPPYNFSIVSTGAMYGHTTVASYQRLTAKADGTFNIYGTPTGNSNIGFVYDGNTGNVSIADSLVGTNKLFVAASSPGAYDGMTYHGIHSGGVGYITNSVQSGEDLTLFAGGSTQGIRNFMGLGAGKRAEMAANGFLSFDIITFNSAPLYLGTNNTKAVTIDVNQNVTFANQFASTLLTVATLPAASVGLKGFRATVSDALVPVYGAAVTGGGAVTIGVICQGVGGWFCG